MASELTPQGGPADPARLRISDAERHQVAEILREAAGEGRLDLDELDQRLPGPQTPPTHPPPWPRPPPPSPHPPPRGRWPSRPPRRPRWSRVLTARATSRSSAGSAAPAC